MRRAVLVVGLLTVLVCAAYAQEPIKANVPFEFVAAGITLPAGNYEFRPVNDSVSIAVKSIDTGRIVYVPVVTRLGPSQTGVAKVTFDKLGEKKVLESVLPGKEEGYLLNGTPSVTPAAF